jgi:hypothetical protein
MMGCWRRQGGCGDTKSNLDGLVKSLKRLFSVIPAQAGIQSF